MNFLRRLIKATVQILQVIRNLKNLLLMHVSLLIDRLHQKISYKNTLVNEICIQYPMIFNIAFDLVIC